MDVDGGDATSMHQCRGGGTPDIQDQAVQREAEPEELVVRTAQEVWQAKAQEWAEK